MTDNRILRRVGDHGQPGVVLDDARSRAAGWWRHAATITCKRTGYAANVLSWHAPDRSDDDVIDVYGSGPEPIRLRGSGVR